MIIAYVGGQFVVFEDNQPIAFFERKADAVRYVQMAEWIEAA